MKKENYLEKLNALRKLFADVVEKNFYARCQYVQLMFNPDKGEFVRLVNEFNPPPMPPNSVQFPLVARGLDFKCLQDFTFTNRDKIDPNIVITDDPFAVAYDELLRLDLFDEYREHRAKIYSAVFEAWAQEHQQEIEAINLN